MKESDIINLKDLDGIAHDEGVRIPESFEKEVESTIHLLGFLDGLNDADTAVPSSGRPGLSLRMRIIGVAASLALLAGLGFGLGSYLDRPRDTYSDPYKAYAELEQAFSLISSKVEKGARAAQKAEDVMDKTNQILANIQ